ncbi:RecB family exonuclease [Actinoplanes palleronii]|uniref:RecB family exonuclease n=1 Tax=Actinoplanes palleronii TaxID=113570 RepID=UPI0035A25990
MSTSGQPTSSASGPLPASGPLSSGAAASGTPSSAPAGEPAAVSSPLGDPAAGAAPAGGPAAGVVSAGDVAAVASQGAVTAVPPLVRDPAAVAAEVDATGQLALVDAPPGAAEAARLAAFLSSAGDLLPGYFAVEDPQRLEPAERETLISTMIGDELLIRGYIDRLDISPAGDLRVVDYKTGGAPREAFEGRALFQLKFYALVLWRTRGVVPRVLRLLYLKDAEVLDYSPEADELERFERTLVALSQAVERAKSTQDFRPKPSRLCGWCNHQAFCPEFGGTPPPFPQSPTAGLPADSEPDRLSPAVLSLTPVPPSAPTPTTLPPAAPSPSSTDDPVA